MEKMPTEEPVSELNRSNSVTSANRQRLSIDPAEIVGQGMLMGVSETVVSQFENYTGWLVAAFAGGSGLMLANYDRAIAVTDANTVQNIIWIFFWVAALQILQRMIGLHVTCAVRGMKIGEQLDLKNLKVEELPRLLKIIEDTYPWPLRNVMALTNRKLLGGDFLVMARLTVRASLVCTILAAIQALLVLCCVGSVALALK